MKPSLEQIEAALRASAKEAEQLRRQNRELREADAEPIAIVGMACRLPGGVTSPAQLWDLLERGGDAIGAFPADRGWDLERIYDPDPERPATSNTREGGFLAGAADFDPGFFGISPREAIGADPQTRLMLESSWEALEVAGVDPTALHGSQAGVFAGVMYHDYGWGLPPTAEAGKALSTGGSSSVVSGHVAYTLGLKGPALSVDTACSSSLVGIHLACQALRRGECSLALAGGVTVLATPGIFVQFSRQGGVAPDGRCKAFSEAADGAGFSEGVGVLVLERLSDAEASGRRVLATIRGSAVNQDGASNGITAPNGPSQERVIRQALAGAGLEPADVAMVEAHGTGTALGDPIEANALLATYGQERETPLKLGSLKSNIGHAQAAAGVAGVIKAVLAMREGVMPKTLHADRPSPRVDWEAGKVELLRDSVEWEADGRPRRAAVSSFGATGTNAHLILEEAPGLPPGVDGDAESPVAGPGASAEGPDRGERERALLDGPLPFLLSAKSEAALREQAARLSSRLREDPALDPLDVAYSLGTTRTRFERRAVLLADGREHLLSGLAALERGEAGDDLVIATATEETKPAFVFSGNGSQWAGMAVELLDSSTAFAESMRECEQALAPFLDAPLLDAMRSPVEQWPQEVELVQPLIFAVMVSLGRLWRACGVEPAAVTGHSAGEIAAAVVVGGLSLEDGARVVSARSRIFSEMTGTGGMVSIRLPLGRLEARIAPWRGRIEIAALNGPEAAVLSGEREALDELLRQCEQEGTRARDIPGAVAASHSSHMEPLRDRLLEELAPVSPRSCETPFYSAVEGKAIDTAALDAEYWYRNTRQTVLFEPVVRELLEHGHRMLIEVSPHPVLLPAMQETIDVSGSPSVAFGTLRRGEGGAERFARSLAEAQVRGARLDWQRFFAGSGAEAVELPTYPFQRKRFWLNASSGTAGLLEAGLDAADHPLLGAAIDDPGGEGLALSGRISLDAQPWLADHAAFETVLLPGTAFVEMALRAGAEAGAPALEELTLEAPLVIAEDGAALLRVSVAAADADGRREVAVHSRPEQAGERGPWTCHARGVLAPEPAAAGEAAEQAWARSWPPPGAEPIDLDRVYEQVAEAGLEYGPAFQGLVAAWQVGGELYAEVSLPAEQLEEAARFGIHPALFDAIGHADVARSLGEAGALEAGELPMPFAWRGVRLAAPGARTLRLRRSIGEQGAALVAVDEDGAPVLSVDSVVTRPVDRARLRAAAPSRRSLYRLDWRRLSPSTGEPAGEPEIEDLRETDKGDPATVAKALAIRVLARMREHLAAAEEDSRLVILSEGALATAEAEAPNIAAASLAGLIRSAAAEHPGRFCLIDTDGSEASEAAIERALGADRREAEIALREGELLVPRLVQAKGEGGQAAELDPERTVLITGATGGIGALIAEHLVEVHGARRLLLVSRSGEEAPGALDLRARLQEQGAEATIAACDVSDRSQLEGLLAAVPKEHPLGAVIHCAAVLDDGLLDSIDEERLERVFAPKADAAWHLHELSAGLDLTHFVCFSSIAGLIGSPGQANYAAANAFLDALAAHRRATGLAGASMAWGGWERRSAMAAGFDREQFERMMRQAAERLALLPLSAERGLALFDAALAAPEALIVPAELDLGLLRSRARSGALPALFGDLVRVPARAAGEGGSLARRLAAVPEAEREALVVAVVRDHVAAVLGHDSAAEVEPEKAFKDLGFDSLAAVELRNRLAAESGVRLAATAVFDYPSPLALAGHLLAAGAGEGSARRATAARSASEEPIAIVGMACRFPGGVESPRQLWDLLARGGDAISRFPADRGWDLERLYDPEPGRPRKSYAKEGGFLYDAADFDPGFFGISPREAIEMDPQQRLMLELSWEVLEDAGIDPRALRGSATGVFAGSMYQDYGEVAAMTSSAVSGRVSYTLGLEGPAISVDTACSSSLVATHLAAGALRGGECDLALAGGVAVLSTPAVFVEFSRQRGLAPDGRSKAFAAAADGVGVSEGVGVLVLERLSDAEAKGRHVLATIRGSAVNQDGASNGLTAPNGPSQERVIRQALANAGLGPADVDMVEAHGTGTTLGDPIEAGALLATYGQEREEPVRLGSLKSNIGHAQAAAGVAGVIKAVLAMREGTMPRTIHLDSPSPNVDWEAGKVELLGEPLEWKPNGRPRRAGVSSFGATGTNAHLIVEEAPAPEQAAPAPPAGPLPFVLSAKDGAGLGLQARRLAARLGESPDLDLAALARTLAVGRPAFERRAVVLAAERSELLEGLAAIAANGPAGNVTSASARAGKLAFLFSGQGSQRAGMGRELYESNEACRETLDAVFAELAPHMARPLAEVLWAGQGSAEAALLDRTAFAQPALFAVELAAARTLESLGLVPELLAGHSIGGIVAAHLAGVFDLAGACALVAARGRLMDALPDGGAMVAVEAGEEEVAEAIAGTADALAIAAVNGPRAVVVSGEAAAVERVAAGFRERGRRTKRLAVSHAFHSPLIEPMLAEFGALVGDLDLRAPALPVVSDSSGDPLSGEQATDPAYWVAHARQAVRFAATVQTLGRLGATTFIEVGPGAALAALVGENLAESAGAWAIPTLREGRAEPEAMVEALGAAHAAGAKVEWGRLFGGGAARVELPTYPFRRSRYWLDPSLEAGDVGAAGLSAAEHPLLGAAVELAGEGGAVLLTGRVSLATHPWVADHSLAGLTILPGTALLELALRAAAEVGLGLVEELTLAVPLIVPEQGFVQIQVAVAAAGEAGRRQVTVHSRPERSAGEWVLNASGALAPDVDAASPPPLGPWPPEGAEPIEHERLYDLLAERGAEIGPAFQGLAAAWREGDTLLAEASLAEAERAEADRFGLHPALLDSASHAVAGLALEGGGELLLPFSWQGVRLHAPGASALRTRTVAGERGNGLVAYDEDGAPVISIEAVALRAVDEAQLRAARQPLYSLVWRRVELAADAAPGAVVADFRAAGASALADVLDDALRRAREWLADAGRGEERLTFLTEGAISTAEGEDANPVAAALWGLLRTAQAEHPGRFALLDVDSGAQVPPARLDAALAAGGEQPQLALREGVTLIPRLARVDAGEAKEGGEPFDPRATVLITGGLGGLGAVIARHLVGERGVRRLILVGRSGPEAPGAGELATALRELGAETVRVESCDVADREQLRALLDSIPAAHPLGAVLHSAAVLDDGVLESLDRERLTRVLAPKAEGAWNLHELTRELELSRFVVFSSLAGLLGAPGQANYAAANAFLDALAAHRRAAGLPATSIAWGALDTAGNLVDDERAELVVKQVRRRLGVVPMSRQRAVEMFDAALAADRPLLAPVELDAAALRAQAAEGALPALLSDLVRGPARSSRERVSLARRLAEVPADEHEAVVLELVRDHAAAVLGHASAEAIEPDRPFQELGFDSLAAVELRNRLGAATGAPLPPTLVFDYPSAAALARYLLAELGDGDGDRDHGAAGEESAEPEADEAIERIDEMDVDELIEQGLALRGGEE
jgi:acyl transferase domain-containing protein/acyl carrier protein